MTIHRPSARTRESASHNSLLATGSMPVVGSSRNTTGGSPTREMAVLSLRLLPPLGKEGGGVGGDETSTPNEAASPARRWWTRKRARRRASGVGSGVGVGWTEAGVPWGWWSGRRRGRGMRELGNWVERGGESIQEGFTTEAIYLRFWLALSRYQ